MYKHLKPILNFCQAIFNLILFVDIVLYVVNTVWTFLEETVYEDRVK